MNPLLYTIPESLTDEIDELQSLIGGYLKERVSAVELKAHRVPFGVYEQRKKGTYMVRIRCAAGIITPVQLKKVAELSLRYGSGILHVTTRQELQIHDVALEDLTAIMRELLKVGLSTRGGGGNTVRNITAPWNAGVDPEELFDVTPYAVALTSAMTSRGDSWLLPRKYKITFAGSEASAMYALISDLGFVAQVKGGRRGFKVYAAGGMGRNSQPGHLLHDFLPDDQVLLVAEAVKRVFSKYGNRKNKHAARLRFLWDTLGQQEFVRRYELEKRALLEEEIGYLTILDIPSSLQTNIGLLNESASVPETWKKRYVGFQKNNEFSTVRIPLLHGMIDADKAELLANALSSLGENVIRFTYDQNIALRNIPQKALGTVYRISKRISDLTDEPVLFGNSIACAGASTCQLGICRSRGAMSAVVDRLKSGEVDVDLIDGVRVNISGCSNSCGQHILADLGFFGKVGRKDQHSFPVYNVVAGAKVTADGKLQMARRVDEINARDLPKLVEELMADYTGKKVLFNSFKNYLEHDGMQMITSICEKYREIPPFSENRNYYRDWGETENFSLAGKGTGECSAGLFDLIELDLGRLRELKALVQRDETVPETVYDLALVASRMLLITRGVEAASDAEVFAAFNEHFIKAGLVDTRFSLLVKAGEQGQISEMHSVQRDVVEFAETVERLYERMDNSFQFIKPELDKADLKQEDVITKDLRGVGCPMNFVKTKISLAGMKPGQMLAVLLDDGPPIENVPRSVAAEGHMVLEEKRVDGYWKVIIRKGV